MVNQGGPGGSSRELVESEAETVDATYGATLGQGDIIHLVGSPDSPRLGVIINADCDLANRKTDGVISFLPIYGLSEYLRKFWMFEHLEGQRNQIQREILAICGVEKENQPALNDWLHDEDNNRIVENLATEFDLSGKAVSRLKAQVEKYIEVFSSNLTSSNQFKKLCSYQSNPGDFAKKQVQAAYKNLGEGHLFINEIRGMRQLGYVIRMRRIYSLEEDRIFRSPKDYLLSDRTGSSCGIRTCRLSGVFQFKLAQLFAYQFSRIGLPDEFREMHSLILEDTATQLLGVEK